MTDRECYQCAARDAELVRCDVCACLLCHQCLLEHVGAEQFQERLLEPSCERSCIAGDVDDVCAVD